ncbi:MAG: prolyl oligopeptidase family serine peptidase, partial [Planctomycetota bacterium]|nr:prolyl oligopeptidase family serine peptidase [Planctomycetota bacterium]
MRIPSPLFRSQTSLLALSVLFCTQFLAAQDRMTPELLWKLGRVSDPQVSVEGARLLYSIRTYDLEQNSGRSQVFLMDTAAGKTQQITEDGSNWSARWSPTGAQRVAFLSTRSGAAQIHVMDLGTRVVRRVTSHPGGVSNMAWSPTGTHFSFTAEVKMDPDVASMFPDLPKAVARIYDDLMIRHWDRWNEGTYSHLFVVAASGKSAPVDLLDGKRVDTPLKPFGGGEQICWSPDGKQLCYTAKVVDAPETSTDSSLFLVAVDGSDHRNLVPGRPGYDTDPAWSPDGRSIAFHSMHRAGFEADRNRIMLMDVASQEIRELTKGFDQSASGVTWSSDGKSLLFLSDTQGTHQVYEVDTGGKIRALTAGRYHFGSAVPGPDGAVYCTRMQMERPNEIVRLDGGEPGGGVVLTDVNGSIYSNLSLPGTEARWFEASDGQKIHSWVIYPPDFDDSKKYPMLLYCQGGPQSQVGQWFSFRWNFHLMAAQGYIVLAVNRRGLPGFGQAWNDQISRDWGGQAMRDLLTATDGMFKESYVDRDRTGAVGASFGGY